MKLHVLCILEWFTTSHECIEFSFPMHNKILDSYSTRTQATLNIRVLYFCDLAVDRNKTAPDNVNDQLKYMAKSTN